MSEIVYTIVVVWVRTSKFLIREKKDAREFLRGEWLWPKRRTLKMSKRPS